MRHLLHFDDLDRLPANLALHQHTIACSPPISTLRKSAESTNASSLLRFAHMSSDEHAHSGSAPDRRRANRSRDISGPPYPPTSHDPAGASHHSSPLPQTHWENIPVPFRPRDWPDVSRDMPPSPAAPEPLFAWRLRPGVNVVGPSQQPSSRGRRRPRPGVRLENMEGRVDREGHLGAADVSLLYPQLSPYDDQFSSYSASNPTHGASRSISQPNTPAVFQTSPLPADESSFFPSPRAPTYPPATLRPTRSANNASESTFTDDDEFHLFAEATAGLGPVQAFHHTSSSSSSGGTQARIEHEGRRDSETSHYASSPLEETPTTMFALQQLAQMPQGGNAQRPGNGRSPPYSGVQPWIQSSTRAHNYDERGNPIEDEDDFIDEELPDYAASQAQAHAVQRIEATRRAQELQRRWQQSRYGEG